jgi:hypothetical protein
VSSGHVSVATTKTTRATTIAASFDLQRLLDSFRNRRLVAAHKLGFHDFPTFAMIRLVRRLYDPDATSAL